MSSASSIIAGNAFVRFGVDDKAVGPGLSAVESKLKAFGGTAGELSGRIGHSMGNAITKGIVGAIGIGFANRAMSGLAESLEAAAAGADFKGVGMTIADALRDSIRDVPIAGSVERIAEIGASAILGVDMNAEGKIAASRKDAAANEVRLRAEEAAAAKEAAEAKKKALDEANKLYATISADYAELGGALDPAARKLAEQQQRLTDLYNAAGMPNAAPVAAAAIAEAASRSDASKKYLDAFAEKKQSIAGILGDLSQSALDFGKTPDEISIERLRGVGASQQEIAQAEKDIAVRKLLEAMADPMNSYDPSQIGTTLDQVEKDIGRSGAFGSFSSRIFNSVGSAGTLGEQLPRDISQIAKNTKATADALKNGSGVVFAP